MTCPATVKFIRNQSKITQTVLARLLMVSAQTVSNWESGRAKPDVYNGAILIRLKQLVRQHKGLDAYLPLGGARNAKTGSYTRMYDLMRLLFASPMDTI